MQKKIADYLVLQGLVRTEKLLDKRSGYYLLQAIFIVTIYGFFVLLINTRINSLWLVTLIGIFSAFVYGQVGLVGHDIIHNQVFNSSRSSRLGGIFMWNFLLGLSARWWQDQHNDHHANPNHDHNDPSIDLSLFAFSRKQLNSKNTAQRLAARYQAYLYFPLMSFGAVHMRISGFLFLIKKRGSYFLLELAGIGLNLFLYLFFIFFTFDLLPGLLLISVHHIFAGLYMGSIFAPNHKGMPVISDGDPILNDPLRLQVTTARNLRGNRLVDFIYGGLNYQIEHHLFPSMPRNNLKKAKPIVERFCHEHRVSYHETGIWQSFREIISALHKESREITKQPHQ